MDGELWFVDDDEDNRSQFKELYGDDYRVQTFESAFDAFRAMTTPGVVVIDCSAVGSIHSPHMMYGPICSLIGKHPGARYIIHSAMPIDCVKMVVDDVKREHPGVVIVAEAWNADLEWRIAVEAAKGE